MKRILSLLILFSGALALAEEAEPPIDAGAVISVVRWDAKSKTYDIVMPQYEAQGPNYARLNDLIAAINSAPKTRWERNPEMPVGQQFQLDHELKLQPVLATEKIRGAVPPKSNAK